MIPLFVEQLRGGQPLTVTDPTMTRFLMSLEESVDLVEHAFAHAAAGRPLRPQGARLHGRRPRPGRRRRCSASTTRDPGHRHPARREAVRDVAEPRGAAQGRRPGRLLPGPARRRGPEYELFFDEGERDDRRATTTPRTTPSGSTSRQSRRCLLSCRRSARARAPPDPGGCPREGRDHRGRRVPRLAHRVPAPRHARASSRASRSRRSWHRPTSLRDAGRGRRRRPPPRRRQPGRTTSDVEDGNVDLAAAGRSPMRVPVERPSAVVFANSIQAEPTRPTAAARRAAADVLARPSAQTGGSLRRRAPAEPVRRARRPHYNSFVATFCHARGRGRDAHGHERPRGRRCCTRRPRPRS